MFSTRKIFTIIVCSTKLRILEKRFKIVTTLNSKKKLRPAIKLERTGFDMGCSVRECWVEEEREETQDKRRQQCGRQEVRQWAYSNELNRKLRRQDKQRRQNGRYEVRQWTYLAELESRQGDPELATPTKLTLRGKTMDHISDLSLRIHYLCLQSRKTHKLIHDNFFYLNPFYCMTVSILTYFTWARFIPLSLVSMHNFSEKNYAFINLFSS